MTVSVQSRSRVLPHSHVSHQPKVEALSIIDALVLHYAKSACIWFYEELDTERLIFSLRQTLNTFPQLAGQLRFATYDPDAGHIHRQGRLQISHGSSSDPGVECIIAEADFPMSSILPPTETVKHWDATHIDYGDLLDRKTAYALDDAKVHQNLPSTKIQFTNFKDGGTAIAVGMVHSLADAAALLTFMKDWAATNRALLSSSESLPKLQPLFDPSLIDASAAGNIDARTSDPGILEVAAKLPVHRFDYWASAGPSTPEWALPLMEIPPELAVQDVKLGKPAPFHTWDATAPCESHLPTNPSYPPFPYIQKKEPTTFSRLWRQVPPSASKPIPEKETLTPKSNQPRLTHNLLLPPRRNARHLSPHNHPHQNPHLAPRRPARAPMGRSDPRPCPERRRGAFPRHQHRWATTVAGTLAAFVHWLADSQCRCSNYSRSWHWIPCERRSG